MTLTITVKKATRVTGQIRTSIRDQSSPVVDSDVEPVGSWGTEGGWWTRTALTLTVLDGHGTQLLLAMGLGTPLDPAQHPHRHREHDVSLGCLCGFRAAQARSKPHHRLVGVLDFDVTGGAELRHLPAAVPRRWD
jgi:hypothetical protein